MSITNAPPRYTTEIFNSSLFNSSSYITQEEADLRYLPLSAGVNLGLISGITPGIASPSKALIFDSNIDIIGINSLTSTTLNTTTLNVDTTNNTTDLNVGGNANFTGTTSNILFQGNNANITMSGSNADIIMTGNACNISLSGNASYIKIDNTQASVNSNTGALIISGGAYFGNDVIINTQISFNGSVINQTNAGYLTSISPGTASASKCLVLDVNRDISNIRNLTATNLTGTLLTASQPNITSLGTLITRLRTLISSSNNSLLLESSYNTPLSNSSNASEFDICVKNNNTTSGATCGISFLQTSNNVDITPPSASIISDRFAISQANLRFNTSNIERLKIGYDGIIEISNSTASTSNILGALKLVGGICISNTTDATSITNGGTITTAGGLSVAKTIYCNTLNTTTLGLTSLTLGGTLITASATEINYNDITTIGDAQASKTLVLDSNKDISNIRRLHCDTLSIRSKNFDDTARMIVAIDNSLSDGNNRYLLLGKELGTYQTAEWGYYFTSNNNPLNRQEFGFYGANGIMAIVANRRVGINITTPSVDFEVAGQIKLSSTFTNTLTTESTSISTGSSLFSGGIGCSKTIFCNNLSTVSTASINNYTQSTSASTGTLNIRSVGYGLNLSYSAQYYSRLTTLASGSLAIELNTNSGTGGVSNAYFNYRNTTSTSLALGRISNDSSFIIDLGANVSDYSICLFNNGVTNNTYGIGANDNAILYNSGGSSGHKWYNNTTTGGGAITNKGTNTMTLSAVGALTTADKILSNKSMHVYGNDTTGLSSYGIGLHMSVESSICQIKGYSYLSSSYQPIYINDYAIQILGGTTQKCVGIWTTPATTYPLQVGVASINLTGGYAYFNSSASSGTGSATGSVNFSAQFLGRIAIAGELDVYSDRRIKKNIKDLDEDYVNKFMKLKPKIYTKTFTNSKEIGLIAQDVVKLNLEELYMLHPTEIDEVIDEDGFINPKDRLFTLNYVNMIPILMKKIQMMDKLIKDNEKEIKRLNKELIKDSNELVDNINNIYKLIEELNDELNKIRK